MNLINTVATINKYPEMKEFYFSLLPKLQKYADAMIDCGDTCCSCCCDHTYQMHMMLQDYVKIIMKMLMILRDSILATH